MGDIFKRFALELDSINHYELAIEELSKIGYKEIDYWNEEVLNNKKITWGLDAFLICVGDCEIQLHNHNGGEEIFTLEEIIKQHGISR